MGDTDNPPPGGGSYNGDNNIPSLGDLLRTRSLSQSDASHFNSIANSGLKKRLRESPGKEKPKKTKTKTIELLLAK